MLTFTRAATAELAQKVQGETQEAVQPSTIHSFAISVLLRNPGTGRFPEPLRIADTWEFKTIVRPTLAKRVRVSKRVLDKLIQEMSANWQSLTDKTDPDITDGDRHRFQGAWSEHRDILGYTLLAELPYSLRRALVNHDDLDGIDYDILLVDEYQDLNACDLAVLRLLNEKAGCVVIATGDDDQSIYGWRNAAPEGIRRFLEDYAPAADYPLSITLRCGVRIIKWANHVIAQDPDRPDDKPVLSCLEGASEGDVALLSFQNNTLEARGVAQLVQHLVEPPHSLSPSDILVLMRSDYNRTFSRPIRDELEKLSIPSSDPNYISEITNDPTNRQLIEVLRLLVNPQDSISWIALLKLTHGIGDTFYDYIYDRSKATRTTFRDELFAAYGSNFPDAPGRSAHLAAQLIRGLLDWFETVVIPDVPPADGWGRWIVNIADNAVAQKPTQPFEELLISLDDLSKESQGLDQYLAQMEPLGRDLALAQSDGVRIMTMGGSKGLTVRATIVVGVEDGLVPRSEGQIAEERRILYVAMTRSREYLYCTWARRRTGPTARSGAGSTNRRIQSSFLDSGPVQSQDGVRFLQEHF